MGSAPSPSLFALIGGAFAILSAAAPGGAQAQSACGDSVTVEAGDTLHSIAQRCDTSVSAMVSANPDLSNPNVIHAGQSLNVPGGDGAELSGPAATEPTVDSQLGGYQVESGDTLYSIAETLGTTVQAVIEANPGLDPRSIPIGRVLNPPGEPSDGGAPPDQAAVSVSAGQAVPGEPVSIRASGFPPNVPVEIGAGPPQSEFDVVASAQSDSQGRVRESVTVPDWANQHRRLVFVAQTPDGSIRATSDPIPTVDEPGDGNDGELVQVTGNLVEGVECPALRGDDGNLYALAMPDRERFQPGDRVEVRGTKAEASFCMQGTTLDVQSIQQAQ